MTVPVKSLYDNFENVASMEQKRSGIIRVFRIVIEEESDDAFLTKSSIDSIISQKGQINIPIIFGTVNGDGMSEVARFVSRRMLESVDKHFSYNFPKSFHINSKKDADELEDDIKNFYFKRQKLSLDNITEFVTLRTDVSYFISQVICYELFARYQPGCNQFLYEFQFVGELNLLKKQVKLENVPFACHYDDINYLFGGKLANQVEIKDDSREDRMRKMMCKLWTNFAKYHDPTPDSDNPLSFKWSPVQPVAKNAKEIDLDYLVINDEMKMVQNLNKERMDFWRKAYRKWDKEFLNAKL